MAPTALLPLAPSPPHPSPPRRLCRCGASRRGFTIHTAIAIASTSAAAAGADEAPIPSPQPPPPTLASKPGASLLGGLANTRSWFQYYGSGFSIRVPPSFDDVLEPEDYSAGTTYYGDKAKPRSFEARFASPDRDEIVSVVIKPSNQLKITFLEGMPALVWAKAKSFDVVVKERPIGMIPDTLAKDITDLGTLKEASKIFVPAGAKVYAARTIKVKDEEDIRTYYFYEFGLDKQHVALMATVNNGKTYIAAATAPQAKWDDDGVKLRSAAVSLSLS